MSQQVFTKGYAWSCARHYKICRRGGAQEFVTWLRRGDAIFYKTQLLLNYLGKHAPTKILTH